MRRVLSIGFMLAGLILCSVVFAEPPKRIVVDAGKFDRQQTIISFPVPENLKGALQLRADDGTILPLQIQAGRACFILDSLKAGSTRSYQIEPGKTEPVVTIARAGTQLKLAAGGQEILQYNGEKTPLPAGVEPAFQRGGYIHPVYTPSGKRLTDDYPLNHKHHHGIWAPWTKTEFEGRHPDFWNMGGKTGRVEFASLGESWTGPVASGFSANHRFVDMTAKPEKTALNETWDVTVYRPMKGSKPIFVFDLTMTQNAVDSPLIQLKYHYGGLGFRGRWEWNGSDDSIFLTSEGKGRKEGNETRGRWCWVGGPAEDGKTIGIAILDHPSNFRSPQPMRLNPDQPFFCYSPSQLGDWKIEKGTPYIATYRFITADGAADVADINRLWNDFAEPPKVTVQ